MQKKAKEIRLFILLLFVFCMPLSVKAVVIANEKATIVPSKKTYTLKQNVTKNGQIKTLTKTIKTYTYKDSFSAYKINLEMLASGDEGGPITYRISSVNPDLKEIGIIQYGKKKNYSDLSIQIAIYLESAFSSKSNDEFFKNAYTLYESGITNKNLNSYDYGRGLAQYGTGDKQIYSDDNIKDDIVNSFEIYFYSQTLDFKSNYNSSTSESFKCSNKICYYPNQTEKKNLSTIEGLNIPKTAKIIDVSLNQNSLGMVAGDYKNTLLNNSTIRVQVNSTGICDNCAHEEVTVTFEDDSVVTIPKLAYPNSGKGVKVINSSKMIVYENNHRTTTTFSIKSGNGVSNYSGALSSLVGTNFTQFQTCGIDLIVEGGHSKRLNSFYELNSLEENLNDPQNDPDLTTNYLQIFSKKACNGDNYLIGKTNYGTYHVSGDNNLANNRYCRLYCKEDAQINIPQVVSPTKISIDTNLHEVLTGRYFTLQNLKISSKKTCVTVKTDSYGNPTNTPGINLSLFYYEVYGYSWNDGDTLEDIASVYGITVAKIREMNNMNSDNLIIGSSLKIVLGNGTVKYHVVTNNDTIESIAKLYNVTVDSIRKANNMTAENLIRGSKLSLITKSGNAISYTIRSADYIPSADELNQYRRSSYGGSSGGSGGGGGGGGTCNSCSGSGLNSKYMDAQCAKSAYDSLVKQSKEPPEKYELSFHKTVCKKWVPYIRYYDCSPCRENSWGDYECNVCHEDALRCGDEGKHDLTISVSEYKMSMSMSEINTAFENATGKSAGAGSCYDSFINSLGIANKTGASTTISSEKVTFTLKVVSGSSSSSGDTYKSFMSIANDSYDGNPLSNATSAKDAGRNEDLSQKDQATLIDYSSSTDENAKFYVDLYSSVFQETLAEYGGVSSDRYGMVENGNVVFRSAVEIAMAEAKKVAYEASGGKIYTDEDGSNKSYLSTPVAGSDYNWLAELLWPSAVDSMAGGFQGYSDYYGATGKALLNNTKEAIDDLVECSTFFKNIDYEYEPIITFEYCDEYDIDYTMTGQVSDNIKVEFCRHLPSSVNYECNDSDKVILNVSKKAINGLSSYETLNYLKGLKSETSLNFSDILQTIKHYDCGGNKCTASMIAQALISTNLGAKAEYTAEWEANTTTKYYSILPSGVPRTIPIKDKSILLGNDGLVYPISITKKPEVCEYKFNITNLGERKFEQCYGDDFSKSEICQVELKNEVIKPCETCGSINGINYFYHPINLNNVFPNSEGKASYHNYRTLGSNWSDDKGKETIEEIETNNDKVYANYGDGGNGPEYSYTITPVQTWHIRSYNREEEAMGLGYADFNLYCDEYGKQCRSMWLDGTMGTCEGRVNCGEYYFTDNLTSTPDDLSTRNVYFCEWQDGTSWKGATANEICKYDEK